MIYILFGLIVVGCIASGALFYIEWKEDWILTHKAGR